VVFVSLILTAFGVVAVFPLLWMLSTSFKATGSIYQYPPQFIPRDPTLAGYVTLFRQSDFLNWFKNSVIVTGFTVGINLLFSATAGFAFAKTRFPGRQALFVVILATLMVPSFSLFIPLFTMIVKWGLVNTYLALILPQAASPVGIFLLKQYTETIPDELMNAASIDGAGIFRSFFLVVFPLITPALAAAAIFAFLASWNSFFWPLVATTKAGMRTLPVGLAVFQGQFRSDWALICAGSFMTLLPALVLYVALQKYFVQGIAMTGIKG
jgi:multiple sugar transport system permease protein